MSSNRRPASSTFRTQNPAALVSPLLRWFKRHARDLPWRRTRDPYAVWISEIMLQQTQVKTVIPYWERWMRELPDARALAAASPQRVLKLWEGLGYYTRARNLQRAARHIVDHHAGEFPRRFEEALDLPGIGRYTAGAISSIAFHQPHPILDGNIIRVLTRFFGIAGNPREKPANARLWQIAEDLVVHAGPRRCSPLNQSLMELGALVCAPRSPRCAVCPLRSNCVARRSDRVADFPNLAPRPAATARKVIAFVIERQGRFLVRQRAANTVNAQLWEFPNIDASGLPRAHPEELLAQHYNLRARTLTALGEIRHSITRYRIVLEAFHIVPLRPRSVRVPHGTWLPFAELDALPFTSAHRKILTLVASDVSRIKRARTRARLAFGLNGAS